MKIKQSTAGGDRAAVDAGVTRLGDDGSRGNRQSVEDASVGVEQVGEAATIRSQATAALQCEAIDRVDSVERSADRQEDVRGGRRVGYSADRRGHEGRRSGCEIVGGPGSEVAEGGVGGRQQAEAIGVAGHQARTRRIDTNDVWTDVVHQAWRGRNDVDSAGTGRSAAKQAGASIKIKPASIRAARCRKRGDAQRAGGCTGGQAEGAHTFEIGDGVEGFRHGRSPADEAQLTPTHRQHAVSRRR